LVIAATRQPSTSRIPAFVAFCLVVWVGALALVLAVASVPAFRSPWSMTPAMAPAGGSLFVSEPVTGFVTPYVSFARVRFESPGAAAAARGLELVVAAGEAPLGSPADLRSRTLARFPLHAEGDLEHTWSAAPRQFDPGSVVRVVLTGTSQAPARVREPSA
jgi:hypothetical protein